MTKADLIALLREYPDDTPVFDGRGFDLKPTSITPMKYDDWSNTEQTPDGEIPATKVGISIGPRY